MEKILDAVLILSISLYFISLVSFAVLFLQILALRHDLEATKITIYRKLDDKSKKLMRPGEEQIPIFSLEDEFYKRADKRTLEIIDRIFKEVNEENNGTARVSFEEIFAYVSWLDDCVKVGDSENGSYAEKCLKEYLSKHLIRTAEKENI